MDTFAKSEPAATYDPCAPGNIVRDSVRQDIMIINQNLKDINPILCGQSVCLPGHSYGPQARRYYVLHYIVSGKGEFVARGQTHKLSRGQMFVIFPGEETFYRADQKDPWHYRWVGFDSALDLSNVLTNSVVNAPDCEHLFRRLMDCGKMGYFKEYYICGKIFEILSLLSQNIDVSSSKPDEYTKKAIYYIENNYNDIGLTVAQLARNLNLERSYFSNIFKRTAGKTPQQYIIDFRMDKAAEMIGKKKHSMGEVCHACGYLDTVNFSRMFKQRFGKCPTKYSVAGVDEMLMLRS